MLNNFCVIEELVFFDLWIFDSGFGVPILESGFWFSGFRVAHHSRLSMQTRDEKRFANAGDARYVDKYFLKYDIWPESYLLIRAIAQTICIQQTS